MPDSQKIDCQAFLFYVVMGDGLIVPAFPNNLVLRFGKVFSVFLCQPITSAKTAYHHNYQDDV